MPELFTILRVVISLGAILATLWWLQRRAQKKGWFGRRADGDLVVKQRVALGRSSQVVEVEAHGEKLLLGVTDHQITVLGRTPSVGAGVPLVLGDDGKRVTDPFAGELAAAAAQAPDEPVAAQPAPARLAGSILAPSTWVQAGEALRAMKIRSK